MKVINEYFFINGRNRHVDVRVDEVDCEPWWILQDICDALALEPMTVAELLNEDEKGVRLIPTPDGEQDMLIISERGLWRLKTEILPKLNFAKGHKVRREDGGFTVFDSGGNPEWCPFSKSACTTACSLLFWSKRSDDGGFHSGMCSFSHMAANLEFINDEFSILNEILSEMVKNNNGETSKIPPLDERSDFNESL